MINIEENYVGGGSIASSTSAVNYVDVPMSLLTTSYYNDAAFNTQFLLRIKPTYNGPRLRVQLLDSSGGITYFSHSMHYTYGSSYGATSSTYGSDVDVGALPVYNKLGFEGMNVLIRANAAGSWFASNAPMVFIEPQFFYSTQVVHTRLCIAPYYNTAPTAVSTLRFFFDNTSGANVANYNLYAGV